MRWFDISFIGLSSIFNFYYSDDDTCRRVAAVTINLNFFWVLYFSYLRNYYLIELLKTIKIFCGIFKSFILSAPWSQNEKSSCMGLDGCTKEGLRYM